MKGEALPTRTADGALEVRLRVCEAGPDAVALVYTVLNLSSKPVKDLEFGFAANVDLGGPPYAETQRAAFDKDLAGLVFTDDRIKAVVALGGEPDGFIAGTFPQAHTAMANREWTPPEVSVPEPVVTEIPNGLQLKGANGSYAMAASAEGWKLTQERPGPNIIGAKAVRTIPAGEVVEVTFALAWHFPTWTSSDGEVLRHRYAVDYQDAASVLSAALPRAAEIEKRIVAWQQPIYVSPVPGLLRDAVINGLYVLPRNSWWTSDGRFFQSESFTGCPITETFVCRFYGSFPLAVLFPECERATMRSVAAAQKLDGEIPFGFGSPMGSRSPYYHVQHPIVSPEFALLTWRNAALWNDMDYLKEMYPRVQAALRFAMTLDKDGDGLVNEDPGNEKGFPANQYYDIWPWWGTSAYTGGIWLAALRAGEEMAKRMDDAAFATELRGWYERGLKAFGDKLWTGSYYRLYNDPEHQRMSATSLTNALCGQWFAYASGLGEVMPKECILEQIEAVLRWNAAATPYGAVNGVGPDGMVDETFPDHSAVITIGEVWNFCTMAVYAGHAREAVELFTTSYGNILLLQRTPWNIPWSLDRNTGAIKWGINYYSNPCVWTLLEALDPMTYEQLAKNDMTLRLPGPPQ
ncbi:MAG: GH116 family glycosyl hydrolase [Candidatus Hydrogenedentes bacterium]|nr:GH116 family glycosyl hydrolase [Candidatus Hydrogenedentota bacterium]